MRGRNCSRNETRDRNSKRKQNRKMPQEQEQALEQKRQIQLQECMCCLLPLPGTVRSLHAGEDCVRWSTETWVETLFVAMGLPLSLTLCPLDPE